MFILNDLVMILHKGPCPATKHDPGFLQTAFIRILTNGVYKDSYKRRL